MKKIPENKLLGNIGQQAFTAWIADAGVFVDKPEEDCGIDYLCNVPTKWAPKAGATMKGDWLAVSVRSTKQDKKSILIDEGDAELFLASSHPCAIAIVKRGKKANEAKVALRLVDIPFIHELSRFLSKKQQTLSIRFDTGISDAEKAVDEARKLFQAGHAQQLILARQQHRISQILLSPTLHFHTSEDKVQALITTERFSSQFDLASQKSQRAFQDAIFGKADHVPERLASLPYKPELREQLHELATESLCIENA